MSDSIKIVGLTGGIGSGKSEVAKRFEYNGVPSIDADHLGHEILKPGGPAEELILETFGEDVLTGNEIDRAKLAAKAFADPEARERLNAITHPLIMFQAGRICSAYAEAGHSHIVLHAALLAENGQRDPFLDGLVLVLAPEENRVRWLVERRGMDPHDVRARMAAQAPPESKVALADWVIHNTGDLNHLYTQVDEIARGWMQST